MKNYLIKRNIGYDFKKHKSKIPRLKESKLKQLFNACIRTNNYGDISLIDSNTLLDFNLFNFSFPCTNISVAGKQEGMQDENGNITSSGLYIYGMNIIKIKKPKYIMIENVKNLIGKKFINDFYNIINELNEVGYNCYYPKNSKDKPICLNAKDFGIPQNRERIYVICIRKDIDTYDFEFPIGKDYGIRLKDLLEKDVDEKYYLSQEIQDRFKCNGNKDISHNELNVVGSSAPDFRTIGQRDMTYGIMSTLTATDLDIKGNDCIKRVYSSEGISPTLTTMEGGNRQPKVIENKLNQIGDITGGSEQGNRVYDSKFLAKTQCSNGGGLGGVTGLYKVNKSTNYISNAIKKTINKNNGEIPEIWDLYNKNPINNGISKTLSCDCGHLGTAGCTAITDNYRIRKLTPLECLRLMGFDDEDYWRIKQMNIFDSQIYKMAGNSIVVNVLMAIFKNLLIHIK